MFKFSIAAGLWAIPAFLSCVSLNAQTLSLQKALDAVEAYHPATKSAALQVKQEQQQLPAAAAWSDPVVSLESPTGNFYTVGVTQSFAWPGTYRRQKSLRQAQIARAEGAVEITRQELRLQAALAYSEWQYQQALTTLLSEQDSVLQSLADAAERLFQQGQTDLVAARFARLQAAALQSKLHRTGQDKTIAGEQLRALAGIAEPVEPESLDRRYLSPPPLTPDTASGQNNPLLLTLQQEVLVAEREVAVAKSRGLPGFTLGYLNQGERNSPVVNRFNVGLSLPIWRKQYEAGASAARTGVEIARQNLSAQSLVFNAAIQKALGEAEKNRRALDDYEQTVLPAARSVSDASRRLYEGGLLDLATYLRNRKDALDAELEYYALLRDAQTAALTLRYLTGRL